MKGWTVLVLALAAGGGLGAAFFVGLGWTVNRLARSGRPGTLLAASFVLRMTGAVAGFYLAARAGGKPLLACLLGFMLARVVVTRLHRPKASPGAPAPFAP